jgi:hypothetical protein
MLRSLLLAAFLVSPAPQPADYPVCVTIHNGPIERPDHYGMPYQRKADLA